MDAVKGELESLHMSLGKLHDDNTTTRYPESHRRTLVNILRNCDDVTDVMRDLLRKMSSGNLFHRVQWFRSGRDEMNGLRSRLEAHKTAIIIHLNVVSM